MNIDLEAKCTETHKWVLVAKFRLATEAGDAARALSKLNGYAYRTIDRRWPEEGEMITLYQNGEGAKVPFMFVMKRDADGCAYLDRI